MLVDCVVGGLYGVARKRPANRNLRLGFKAADIFQENRFHAALLKIGRTVK